MSRQHLPEWVTAAQDERRQEILDRLRETLPPLKLPEPNTVLGEAVQDCRVRRYQLPGEGTDES